MNEQATQAVALKDKLLDKALVHLKALISFDTTNPPRKIVESGIIEYLTEQLSDATIEVMDYGQGSINVYAVKGQPKYLFNFHIDTVPVADGWSLNPFELMTKDSKAFGLGSCDIKGAAACFLACVEQGLTDYAVLFSSDEEFGNSLCVKSFLQQAHDYSGIVVAEPTQCQAILAHRGVATAEVIFSAESGHSSEPRALEDNAIHQAATWMNQAIAWASSELDSSYEHLQGVCLNIGAIEGGIKPNIIASQANLKFGIRPLPGTNPAQKLNELCDAITLKQEFTITPKFIAPSFPANLKGNATDEQQELAELGQANSALADSLGLEIGAPVNFWTEAALFSEAGYPAIVYGPGNINKAHAADEWVAIEDLANVVTNYWRILGDE